MQFCAEPRKYCVYLDLFIHTPLINLEDGELCIFPTLCEYNRFFKCNLLVKLLFMHNYSNFSHNAMTVFSLECLAEFDLINEGEIEIGLYDPHVVSPLLSSMRASRQVLAAHLPNPSRQAQRVS